MEKIKTPPQLTAAIVGVAITAAATAAAAGNVAAQTAHSHSIFGDVSAAFFSLFALATTLISAFAARATVDEIKELLRK